MGGTGEHLGGTCDIPKVTSFTIEYVTQPFRVKPGDAGLLGGTGEHLGGTWGHSLSHFPHY